MDVTAVLNAGREAAEALMVDACLIVEPDSIVFDEDSGNYLPGEDTTVYEGPCRVQLTDTLDVQTATVGATLARRQRLTLSVPISVEGVKVDQQVTITASTFDPTLVGRRFRVAGLHHKTHATARRLEVEELTGD